jgi:hypothetical protein
MMLPLARSVDDAFPRLHQDHFLHSPREMVERQSRDFWRKVTVSNLVLPLQLDIFDDEAIFADVVVTDGDTRGSHKFIQM